MKDYESKLAVKSDSKVYTSIMRSRQRKKDRAGPISDDQTRAIINDTEVTVAQNRYFSYVYEKEEDPTNYRKYVGLHW